LAASAASQTMSLSHENQDEEWYDDTG
jgi:hypothetical protein